MIPDSLSLEEVRVSISLRSTRSSTENIILSLKRRCDRFKLFSLSMFLRKSSRTLKTILMILRSFLFSLPSYRFVISTCYFARLDGLSVGNMIPDLLSSAISNEKSLFGP